MAVGRVSQRQAAKLSAPAEAEAPYKYLALDRKGDLVINLPEDPERLFQLARKSGRETTVERAASSEFLEAMEQEDGDGLTRRYENVTSELGRYVSKLPEAKIAEIGSALKTLRTYVEGGEQTTPGGAQGKTPGFYKEFNAAIHEAGSLEALRAASPEKAQYLEEMLAAHETLPGKVRGIVMRGTGLPVDLAERLVSGAQTEFSQLAPMSTSLSLTDATKFLAKNFHREGKVPTLMLIKTDDGKLVSWKGSAFNFEEEVLLLNRNGTKLRVEAAFMAPPPRAGEEDPQILYLFLKQRHALAPRATRVVDDFEPRVATAPAVRTSAAPGAPVSSAETTALWQ
jgi:hypothetical protein